MSNETLTRVALRYQALFVDTERDGARPHAALLPTDGGEPNLPLMAFLRRLRDNGFSVSEELLRALCGVTVECLKEITRVIDDVMGVSLNWASLVRGWDVPTCETRADHFHTLIANIFGPEAGFSGTTLPCGHLIPAGTFHLQRYTSCPFCGTPFLTADHVYTAQGSKLRELRLLTAADMKALLASLLTSATPLDASQRDSLGLLLQVFPLPADAVVSMKETAMLVVSLLVGQDRADEALPLLRRPSDVLRYLWYEKTGYVQVIQPKTLVAHARRLYRHLWGPLDGSDSAASQMRRRLRLKYDRTTCRRVARWLNAMPMTATQAAEDMNPKRGLWVRMIRALRLGEYSHRSGFAHLAEILDVFYRHDYTTFQGQLDQARLSRDDDATLALLRQRPGLFSRCLFATMLRLGSEKVLNAFAGVADQLPPRLLLSLANAADTYFDPKAQRLVRPITGVPVAIEPNRLLALYSRRELEAMALSVGAVFSDSMARRFALQPTSSSTIYIDASLYDIPVGVGDRATTVQDTSSALMGTRFHVEGDAVRLFMQWGRGLPAQPLDMDLSCRIALPGGKVAECAYYNLTCPGARHSGDIRAIPDQVGTAEYVELSLPELSAAGATYVTFTCNAYSNGALSPRLMVGWMDSAHPMTISETDGVAYDPSCVQHLVRISEGNLAKGLVFGVLDVARRQIVWLEMPFTAQTLKGVDSSSVEALLRRLQSKLSIGQLLELKARAQHLTLTGSIDTADEAYTYQWALNPANTAMLLNL